MYTYYSTVCAFIECMCTLNNYCVKRTLTCSESKEESNISLLLQQAINGVGHLSVSPHHHLPPEILLRVLEQCHLSLAQPRRRLCDVVQRWKGKKGSGGDKAGKVATSVSFDVVFDGHGWSLRSLSHHRLQVVQLNLQSQLNLKQEEDDDINDYHVL